MSQRRMFSQKIVGSDAFLEMSTSTRELYFQLGMYADDDGFVSPRKIMRMVGASDDDLKILIAKRFLLPCENGVVVVKHWRINNQIRTDRYTPSIYAEHKKGLFLKENGAYSDKEGFPLLPMETLWQPNGNQMATQIRLGKDSIGKNNTLEDGESETDSLFEEFWKAYPKRKSKGQAEKTWDKLKPTRALLEKMIAAIEKQKESKEWKKDNGQFIPYPSTWLNAKGWEDDVEVEQKLKPIIL